ncbi:PREDICTED: neuropeptide F receptor-like [Nicrophorus vespilloides]|uniref:Neuropeptide F receptor-like n=1 Tax=Nicrophorus vespilloides TaxID=110193 RepID=A0ABM1MYD9_NICVS|nr:PREDICTED: neuropeptide F receptor-like [Nicrophorus vespilloides]
MEDPEIFGNASDIVMRSRNVDPELIDRYIHNTAIDQPAYGILISIYVVLIVLGALGNTLVILSVVRKPAMRTARNMFIVNLAISDLLLCTVTMPLTLMEILTKYFPLGNNAFVCKMIGTLQAISIFVSTISITAIALDRYQVIVYPTRESLQLFGAILILVLIWVIATILASPLFIYKQLAHYEITINDTDLHVNYCYEEWPPFLDRYVYSVFSLVVQYIIPILTVSAAYFRILYKLKYRFAAGFVDDAQNSRRQLRGRRLQRTNFLLVSIAVIFLLSWLPLNLYNLIADICKTYNFNTETMKIVYAVCHMMGMSSACWNPFLYGWLNENFWKEFQDILCLSSTKEDKAQMKTPARKPSSLKSQYPLQQLKPDLITDFNQATTADTEMTQLSK